MSREGHTWVAFANTGKRDNHGAAHAYISESRRVADRDPDFAPIGILMRAGSRRDLGPSARAEARLQCRDGEMHADSVERDPMRLVDAFVEHAGSSSHAARESFDSFARDGIAAVLRCLPEIPWAGRRFLIGGRDGTSYRLLAPPRAPAECRLVDCTYSAPLEVDLVDAGKGDRFASATVGHVPLMLGCAPCVLAGASGEDRYRVSECVCDAGGYFVVSGKEKAIAFLETRSLASVVAIPPPRRKIDTHAVSAFATACVVTRTKTGEYTVRVPVPGMPKHGVSQVSVALALRCLESMSDRDIVKLVRDASCGAMGGTQNCHRALIATLCAVARFGPTSAGARSAVSKTCGLPGPAAAVRAVRACVPGARSDAERCVTLASVWFECIRVAEDPGNASGVDFEKFHASGLRTTSRASFASKRLVSPGELLRDLLLVRMLEHAARSASITSEPAYLAKQTLDSGAATEMAKILWDSGLEAHLSSAFKSSTRHPVFDVPRFTAQEVATYTTRVIDTTPLSTKEIQPRRVQSSQLGFVCALETPEGENVGQVKSLALMASVTGLACWMASGRVRDEIARLGVRFESATASRGDGVLVLVDGVSVGFTREPEKVSRGLRDARRAGKIHREVGVEWTIGSCVQVHTEEGRLIRPLILADGMESSRRRVPGGDVDFDRRGSRGEARSDDARLSWETMVSARDDSAPMVEYVDARESNSSMIAAWASELRTDGPRGCRFTHSEIHPCAAMSLVANMLAFPERNVSTRNVFSCKHIKRSCSVYATSFRSRMDTEANILHAGQRPLVSSRLGSSGAYRETALPFGVNAIVAIACFSGYNQEDALIVNRSAVQRGLFATTHVHTLSTDEERGETFCDPTARAVVPRAMRYDGIGPSGLPAVGERIRPGDAIVGKVSTLTEPRDGVYLRDTSLVCDLASRGVVHRAIAFHGPNGDRRAKVTLYDTREPDVGDKFATRHGQKGVCGYLIPEHEMPCTHDGLVPDMIMNPHAFPKRMTVGQFVEGIAAKAMCLDGGAGLDASAITGASTRSICERLARSSEMWGGEVLIDPRTGRTQACHVTTTPTYFMRLKQQVADKINASHNARRDPVTGQPVRGRAEAGALRIGEMERDAILAHGLSGFLHESMTLRSDGRPIHPQTFADGVVRLPDAVSGLVPKQRTDLSDAGVTDDTVTPGGSAPRSFSLLQSEASGLGLSIAALGATAPHSRTQSADASDDRP